MLVACERLWVVSGPLIDSFVVKRRLVSIIVVNLIRSPQRPLSLRKQCIEPPPNHIYMIIQQYVPFTAQLRQFFQSKRSQQSSQQKISKTDFQPIRWTCSQQPTPLFVPALFHTI